MILQDKDINDATVLKLVASILRKNQSNKKFKLNTKNGERVLTYDEIIAFIVELAQRLNDGGYGAIHRCDTCGSFNPSGKHSKRGWCSPPNTSLFRNKTDHCSQWTPMTEEQKRIKEVLHEHFKSLQTK